MHEVYPIQQLLDLNKFARKSCSFITDNKFHQSLLRHDFSFSHFRFVAFFFIFKRV